MLLSHLDLAEFVEYALTSYVHFCFGTLANVLKRHASFPQEHDGYERWECC